MARRLQERSQRHGPRRLSWLRTTLAHFLRLVHLLPLFSFLHPVQTSETNGTTGDIRQDFSASHINIPFRYETSQSGPFPTRDPGQFGVLAPAANSFTLQTPLEVEGQKGKSPAADAQRVLEAGTDTKVKDPDGFITGGALETPSRNSSPDIAELGQTDLKNILKERDRRARSTSADITAESLNPFDSHHSIQILVQPKDTESGHAFSASPTIEVVDRNGDRVTSFHGLLNVQLHRGDAKKGAPAGDLTKKRLLRGHTIARAEKGYVVWKGLSIDEAANGYYLRFIDLSGFVLSPALSDPFNVFPGPPTQLVVTRQPPAAVDPGEYFDVSFEVQDSHGNPAFQATAPDERSSPYVVELTLVKINGVGEGKLSVDGKDGDFDQDSRSLRRNSGPQGTASFGNIFVTNFFRGELVLKGVCSNCLNGPLEAVSRSFRVTPSTAVTVYSDCGVLLEGEAPESLDTVSDSEHQCMILVKLSQGGRHSGIPAALREDVRVRVAAVKLLGVVDLQGSAPGIRVLPEELVFHASERLGIEKAFTVETIDDDLPWARPTNLGGSSPWMQHYRVEVDVVSEDPLWTAEAVVWPNGNSVDLVVHENDVPSVIFEAPGHVVLSGLEGEMEYMIALSHAPRKNLFVVVDQSPGILTVPNQVLFTPESWQMPQPVKVYISEDGLTDPSVVSAGTAPGRGSRILILRHRVEFASSAKELVDASTATAQDSQLFRMENNGFLAIVVFDADVPAIKWDNSEVLVEENTAFELAFQFGNKPAAEVVVRIDCESPYIRHVKRQTTVAAEDWLFGDEFLFQSQIRPQFEESTYSVNCYVACTSKDPRFNFDKTTILDSERESAVLLGLLVKLIVHKKVSQEGHVYHASSLPLESSRDAQSSGRDTSDELQSLSASFYFPLSEGIMAAIVPWCPMGYRVINGKCEICPANTYTYLPTGKCFPCRIGYVSPPGAIECRLAVANRIVMQPDSSWFLSSNAGRFWSPPENTKYSTQTCGFDMSGEYSMYGLNDCVKTYKGHMNPSIPFDGRLYTCPEGFTIGSDQQCWEPVRGNYSLGAHSKACKKGSLYRTAENKCRPCEEGFSCKHDGKYNSWMTRCTPGYGSATGSEDCQKCQAGYFCPGYMEPFHVPPLKRYPGWYESGEPPSGDNSRYIMQGFCGMGTYGRSFIEPEGQPGEYYAPYNKTCVTCPPGHYCYDVGIVDFQDYKCTFGHYCLGGDSPAIPCPPGRYYPFRGASSSNSCLICPDGFICETLDQKVTPELCPKGYICPYGRPPMKCPAGTINPYQGQSALEQCNRCPPGHYCPDPVSEPKPCPVGTYSPHEGLESEDDCLPCPPGYYCDELALTLYHKRCEPGGYCEGGASVGPYKTPCPEGTIGLFYAASSSVQCQPCPAGSYCPEGATVETVKKCPAGHYCRGGAKVPCPPGYMASLESLINATDCVPCKPGYYCTRDDASVVTEVECPAGHYCPLASAQPTPCPQRTFNANKGAKSVEGCIPCPPGNHCPQGSSKPTVCPPGTYGPTKRKADRNECEVCPGGYYCNEGTPVPCGKGKYSPEGARECTSCPKGFYCPTDTVAYLQLTGLRCPPGAHCPEGTGTIPLWLLHQRRMSNATVAAKLVAQNAVSGLPSGSMPDILARGFLYGFRRRGPERTRADPAVASVPYEVLRRRSWSLRGFKAPKSHLRIPASPHYTSRFKWPWQQLVAQQVSLTSDPAVDPGIDTEPGLDVPALPPEPVVPPPATKPDVKPSTPAPGIPPSAPGSGVAPSNSVPGTGPGMGEAGPGPDRPPPPPGPGATEPPPTGEAGPPPPVPESGRPPPSPPTTDKEGVAQACPAGHYCISGHPDPVKCPPGTYNALTGRWSASACLPLPAGFFCESGGCTTSQGEGLCAKGHYCPEGSFRSHQTPCPPGTYRNKTGGRSVTECWPCSAGSLCERATSEPKKCPKGFYCPFGSSVGQPCPLGTYSDVEGTQAAESCKPCPRGKYCNTLGATTPTGDCEGGFYCTEGLTTPTPRSSYCPSPGFCPVGATLPRTCPDGQYIPSHGSADGDRCVSCPAGYYCKYEVNKPSSVKFCKAGYYCMAGSTEPEQHEAPKGSFAPRGSSRPFLCPAGSYTATEAQAQCTKCPAGKVCTPHGVKVPVECPIGFYCPAATLKALPCPKGKYGASTGLSAEAQCTTCPPGKYCGVAGLTKISGLCEAGYYCSAGSSSPAPHASAGGSGPCPPGSYCPREAPAPKKCPKGKYNPFPGRESEDDCLPCPAGSYCEKEGLAAPSGLCPAGFECREGTVEPTTKCKKHTYAPEGSQVCLECPAGTEQPEPGRGSCNACKAGWACNIKFRGMCEEGFYCPKGTIVKQQHRCPLGFSGKGKGLTKLSACSFCPPGGACNGIKDEVECGPGFYCTGAHLYPRAALRKPTTYVRSPRPAAISTRTWQQAAENLSHATPARQSTFDFAAIARAYSVGKSAPWQRTLKRLTLAAGLKSRVLGIKTRAPHQATVDMSCVEWGVGVTSSVSPTQVDNVDSAENCMALCQVRNVCTFFSWNSETRVCQILTTGFSIEACVDCWSGPKSCDTSCFVEGIDFQGTTLLVYAEVQRPLDCQWRCASDPECGVFVFDSTKSICYTRKYDALGQRLKAESGVWAGPAKYCGFGGTLTGICRYPTGLAATVVNYCGRKREFPKMEDAAAHCEKTPGCTGIQFFKSNSSYSARCGEPDHDLYKFGAIFFPQLCGFSDLCEPGYYCPAGSGFPALCDEGKFCPDFGLEQPAGECAEGFWCGKGEKLQTPSYSTCPKGHYCPQGTEAPVPCPEGKYRPFRGGRSPDDCVSCTPGFYCSGTGLTEPTGPCSRGFYCGGGDAEPAKPDTMCPPGSYCPAGSVAPVPCPPGQTQPLPGQFECETCPAGYYCGADGKQKNCPAGFYCPEGTQFPQQFPCPPGTYLDYEGARDESECMACPEGRVCDDPGDKEADTECPAGHFCLEGTDELFGDNKCTFGEYCPKGSAEPSACPPGYHCNTEGLELPSGRCYGGFLCTSRASAPCPLEGATGSSCPENVNGEICPPGNFCLPSSVITTVAGTGTAQDDDNKTPAEKSNLSQPADAIQYSSVAGKQKAQDSDGETPGENSDVSQTPDATQNSSAAGTGAGQDGDEGPTVENSSSDQPADTAQDSGVAESRPAQDGDEGTAVGNSNSIHPAHAIQNSSLNNDIFFVDKIDKEVKRIDASTGKVVTTVRADSNHAAKLGDASPERLALGRAGTNLYISYPSLNKIILHGVETGEVTELVSNVPEPVGMFVDFSDTFLYVASRSSHKIYKVNIAEKTSEPWLGTGETGSNIGSRAETELNAPEDVLLDEEGSVFVADTGNKRILRVTGDKVAKLPLTSSKFRESEETSAAYALQKPVSLVLRTSGSDKVLFVADETANRIWSITIPEGVLDVVAGNGTAGYSGDGNSLPASEAQLSGPTGIGTGTKSEGLLYDILVADSANKRIRRLSLGADIRARELTAESCPAGTYLPWAGGSSIAECVPCPPGMYCEGAGQPVPSGRCQDGYYCPQGAASPTAFICPENHFCKGSAALVSVTKGKSAKTTVTTDFVGAYRPDNAVDGNEDKGWLSSEFPEGESHGLEVDFGDFFFISQFEIKSGMADGTHAVNSFFLMAWSEAASDWIMATSPVDDVPGATYAGAIVQLYTKKVKLVVTQPQVYISEFTVMGTDAPGPSKPTPCLPGTLQKLRGQIKCELCPAGFYCLGGADSKPIPCPEGFYCPEGVGMEHAFPCPYGTYGAATELKAASDCTLCPAGEYCAARGLSAPSGKCNAGYFCAVAAFLPTPRSADVNPDDLGEVYVNDLCPVGHYCEEGTTEPVACTSGTMSQSVGAKSEKDCVPCPPGFACPAGSDRIPCAAGYVCETGCTSPRPSGLQDDRTSPGPSEPQRDPCRPCSPGFYCPEGSYREQPCLPGTFSDSGQEICSPCTAGYYCSKSKTAGRPTELCREGNYCPEGSVWPKLCPPGTVSSSTGAAECTPCMRSHYCSGYGLTAPTGLCDAGFVCVSGAKARRPSLIPFGPEQPDYGACPQGHYCPRGTHEPRPCTAGTYQDSTMSTSCKPCEPGFYCAGVGLTAPSGQCAAGYYCLSGSPISRPTNGIVGGICPAGWFCPEGSFTPQPCPAGFYTAEAGAQSCAVCPRGFACSGTSPQPSFCPPQRVCPEGSAVGELCPTGSYANKEHEIRDHIEKDCSPCPVGRYCRRGVIAGDCAAGYFCGLGNGYPHPDPSTGLEGPYIPGSVKDEGERAPMNDHNWNVQPRYGGIPCPVGHYCPGGCTAPQKCPAGTVVVGKGARFVSDCAQCPAGFYCKADSAPVLCPAGNYCPAGSTQPLPCSSGTFNPNEGAPDTDACLACPRGYRCKAGQSALTAADECPPGHFCPGGTSTPVPCPPGTSRPESKGDQLTNCDPCPPGFYCEGEGNAYPTGLCPTGRYCEEETAVPQPCPVGTYCPEGLSEPITCPAGFYCPPGSGVASQCPTGRFCPAGVLNPELCSPGTYANPVTAGRAIAASACLLCPKGTYSALDGAEECEPCTPGYLCFQGCNAKYPADEAIDKGKPCPPGFYCPAGSFEAIPCPVGTYNPYDRQTSLSSCLYCKGSTFGTKIASTTCVFCGGSSITDAGGTSCRCEGKNRIYQPSIQACVCRRGFDYFQNGVDLSDQDGDTDCVERVYSSCDTGFVRDNRGQCIMPTDMCAQQCPSGTGTYQKEFDSCICSGMKTADEVCNISCRRRMNKLRLKETDLIFFDSENVKIDAVPLSKLTGRSMIMAGEPVCADVAGCPVIVFNSTEAGLKGLYGPPGDLLPNIQERLSATHDVQNPVSFDHTGGPRRAKARQNATLARGAQDMEIEDYINPGIWNPVRCIMQGTSVAFLVHPGTENTGPLYPVYLRESFFNTESNFDFGQLSSLETDMLSGADRMLYLHTFTQPGVFVFSINGNKFRYAIIKVAENGREECPEEASYFQPQSETMLRILGIQATSTLTLQPDWGALFGTLGGLLFLCVVVSSLLAVFRLNFWVFPGAPDGEKKSFLAYLKERLLCAKRYRREVEAGEVLEDFDPRIFQAIYMELLATQNTIAEGVALVSEQQAKADYDAQDKEIQLRSQLVSFLRNTLDGLEEAISAQKHNFGTLAKTMRLLMLRKDGLLDFVSETRAAAEHPTESYIQEGLSTQDQKLLERSDSIHSTESDNEKPYLHDDASDTLASAIRELGRLLQDELDLGQRRALLHRFRKQIYELDTPYKDHLASLQDNKLEALAGTVAKDEKLGQLREGLYQERTAHFSAVHNLLLHFDEAVSCQCGELSQERARCLGVAYTAAIDAYKQIEPLLNPQLGEAVMVGAYGDFARNISLARSEFQNAVAKKRAELSKAIVDEARNVREGSKRLFASRATLLEGHLAELRRTEAGFLKDQFDREEQASNELPARLKAYVEVKQAVGKEARLGASLLRLEEKFFPDFVRAAQESERSRMTLQFEAERQTQIEESNLNYLTRKQELDKTVDQACSRWFGALLKRHGCEYDLLEAKQQLFREQELSFLARDREEGLLGVENLLLSVKAFVQVMEEAEKATARAFTDFSKKLEIITKLDSAKQIIIEGTRASKAFTRSLEEAEKMLQRRIKEEGVRLSHQMQKKTMQLHAKHAKEWTEKIAKQKGAVKLKRDQLEAAMEAEAKEIEALGTFIAKEILEAETAAKAGVLEFQLEACQARLLKEERRSLCSQLREVPDNTDPVNRTDIVNSLLDDYLSAQMDIHEILQSQSANRQRDLASVKASWVKGNEMKITHLTKIRVAQIEAGMEKESQCEEAVDKCIQACIELDRGLFKKFLEHFSLCRLPAELPEPPSEDAEDYERKQWLDACLEVLRTADVGKSQAEASASYMQWVQDVSEKRHKRLAKTREEVSNFMVNQRLEETKLDAIHSIIFQEDKIGALQPHETQSHNAEQQVASQELNGSGNEENVEEERTKNPEQPKTVKQGPCALQQQQQHQRADAVLDAERQLRQLRESNRNQRHCFKELYGPPPEKPQDAGFAGDEGKEQSDRLEDDECGGGAVNNAGDAGDSSFDRQSLLLIKKLLSSRAARRQRAKENTEAGKTEDLQMQEEKNELTRLQTEARRQLRQDRAAQREEEKKAIEEAMKKDEKLDLGHIMIRRQQAEMDALLACQMREKFSVMFFEKEVRRAELEEENRVAELLRRKEGETEAEESERWKSQKSAEKNIQEELRAHLQKVEEQLEADHAREVEALRAEHVEQLNNATSASGMQILPVTAILTSLHTEADIDAWLRQLETDREESARKRLEEFGRQEQQRKNAERQEREKKQLAADKRRREMQQWRQKVTKKRGILDVGATGDQDSNVVDGQKTAAFLSKFSKKVAELANALEHEQTRQEQLLNSALERKMSRRQERYGESTLAEERAKRPALVSAKARRKEVEAKKLLWKRCGSQFENLNPMLKHILDEEIYTESFKRFKEEGVLIFRGRFMRLLEQLEKSLRRGSFLWDFVEQMHMLILLTGGVRLSHLREEAARPRHAAGGERLAESSNSEDETDSSEESERDSGSNSSTSESESETEEDESSSSTSGDSQTESGGSSSSSSGTGSDTSGTTSESQRSSEGGSESGSPEGSGSSSSSYSDSSGSRSGEDVSESSSDSASSVEEPAGKHVADKRAAERSGSSSSRGSSSDSVDNDDQSQSKSSSADEDEVSETSSD